VRPFEYPPNEHERKHGPRGYQNYKQYRPWLRDEFVFRCVYCLKRERWGYLKGSYDLDHYEPQTNNPEATLDYDNLLYSCATCNSGKGSQAVPDPCECMLSSTTKVSDDGSITGLTDDARKIILKLSLDDPEYREFRRLLIGIVELSERQDGELFYQLMSVPSDLPDLSKLKPQTNSRPEGVAKSYYQQRVNGELPDTY